MASELAWKKSEEAVGSPNYALRGSDNHIRQGHIGPAFFISLLAIAAINLNSRTIPKVSRCTVDMLNQILYDKTQDVGKISESFQIRFS